VSKTIIAARTVYYFSNSRSAKALPSATVLPVADEPLIRADRTISHEISNIGFEKRFDL